RESVRRSVRQSSKLQAFYRKLEHESTSPGMVVAGPDEAVMVGDDRRDDREAEPGAAFAGRKIRLEDPGSQPRIDSRTIVADFERDHATADFQAGPHLDTRALALVIGRLERVDG